jgi:AraC-like DNA-binding protein
MRNLGAAENARSFLEATHRFSAGQPYRIWRKEYHGVGERVRLHHHPLVELLLPEEVKGRIGADGADYLLPQTPLLYLHPGSVHEVEIEGGSGSILVLQVHTDILASLIDLNSILTADSLSLEQLPPVPVRHREIGMLMKELEAGKRESAIGFSLFLLRLIELLCDGVRPSGKGPLGGLPTGGGSERIRAVIDWTEKHHREEISLERAAEEAGYCRTSFCRFFRKATGSSYFTFLRQVRLEDACRLLESGESVTDAAYLSGFGDLSWFIECFSECYGITPKQFQIAGRTPTPP